MVKLIILLIACVYASSYSRQSHICGSGYYWTGQTCMPCSPGCTCSTYMTCSDAISCPSGYIQQNITPTATSTSTNTANQYQCVSCPTGCSECSLQGTNGFTCSECQTQYQLINKICVPLSFSYVNTNSNANSYAGTSLWWQPTWTSPIGSPALTGSTISVVNCLTLINSTTFCESCPTGSFLNEKLQCELCTPNCESCKSRGTCTTCVPNTFWNANANTGLTNTGSGSGSCTACTAAFAATCDSTGAVPITCLPGYYLTGTPASCAPCSNFCSTCTNATTCQTCIAGTYLNNGTCNLCPGNVQGQVFTCKSCSSTTCNSCFDTIVSDLLLVGNVCLPCSNLVGCAVCTSKNSQLSCSTCMNGYYRTKAEVCAPCTLFNVDSYLCNNTDESSEIPKVVVTQCQTSSGSFTSNNYFLVPTVANTKVNTCVSNTNICLNMSNSTGTCTECAPGYTLIVGACAPCSVVINCVTCSAPASGSTPVCTACNTLGNYLANGACVSCSAGCQTCTASGCTQCYPGYSGSTTCTACSVSNCQTCSTSTTCTACQPQFYLYTPTSASATQQCLLCPPGCSDCTSSSGMSCTTCLSGFYKFGTGCYPGAQYCAQYNSDGSCDTCQYGAYLNNGYCYPCIATAGGFVCLNAYIMSIAAMLLILLF